jgi:hypothetical protein
MAEEKGLKKAALTTTVSDTMCELYTDPYHHNGLTKTIEQNHL